MYDCDVLIVGGGPVGLFLAAELGQRGVTVQLYDAKPGTSTHPAANANSARTMEHFRRIGVADAVRAAGLPRSYPPDIAYFTSIAGHELARLHQPASELAAAWARAHAFTWPTAEPPHRCSQLYVEPILLAAARAQPTCRITFSASVESFEQDAEGVTASVAFAAPRSARVRARYLVGCDGPRSAVRKAANIRYRGVAGEKREFMGGQMAAIYFHAPALYRVTPHAPAWQYWTFSPTQRALVIAVDGQGHFVMNVQLRDGETLDHAAIRDRLVEAVGVAIPFEIKSNSSWTAGHALVAEQFAAGRAFLAGDAAHLFTPTGGLGYNTGIEDAANLAWKLEALIRGHGGPALAGSYHAERYPAALRNTNFARELADGIGHIQPPPGAFAAGPDGTAMREAVGDYLAFHAYHEFVIPGVHLGTRYEDSPLIKAEPGPPTPDAANHYHPCARPGHRAPHGWLGDGASLYDRFGRGFTLLCLDGESPSGDAVHEAHQALPGLTLAAIRALAIRDLYQARFALIRPDQHVAWRGDMLDADFLAGVRRTLGAAA